ncbi:hypothetical protein ACS0TY_007908 [Phlomoides rotata]
MFSRPLLPSLSFLSPLLPHAAPIIGRCRCRNSPHLDNQYPPLSRASAATPPMVSLSCGPPPRAGGGDSVTTRWILDVSCWVYTLEFLSVIPLRPTSI